MDEQPVPGGAGGGGQLTYKNINSKVWFRRRASAVLLSNLIPEFSSARQKHGVWTGPKWDQNMQFTLAKKNNGYAPAFSFGSLLSEGCLRGVGGGGELGRVLSSLRWKNGRSVKSPTSSATSRLFLNKSSAVDSLTVRKELTSRTERPRANTGSVRHQAGNSFARVCFCGWAIFYVLREIICVVRTD